MIRAVAWDIDGTLVDSEPLHLFALQQVCADHGVDISDLADDHFIGVHLGNVWAELAPRFPAGLGMAAWSAALNEVYRGNVARLTEIEAAAATIRALAGQGLRQVAVSNSNRVVVDANLGALFVAEHFAFSLSLDDVLEGKPDPFPYRLACARLRLPPEQVIAVEDSATGAASALGAGLHVAFLTTDRAPAGTVPIAGLGQLPDVIAGIAADTRARRNAGLPPCARRPHERT